MTNSTDLTPVEDLLSLKGSTALVTGASGNIGRGIASRLAEAGASVIVHYSSGKRAASDLVSDIEELGGTAALAKCDLRSDFSTANMLDRLKTDSVAFDLVVNNAAVQPVQPVEEISRERWRFVQESNLESAFMVSKTALRRWRKAKVGGAIVNIASIEGLDPAEGHSHYASSKAGLLTLTRSLAQEYGEYGCRVNSVSPGLVERDGLFEEWPDGVDRWKSKSPLGRLGQPADVADAVLFLLSPASRWISGANLVVDGGMSAAPRW